MQVFLEGVVPTTQPWVSSQDNPAGGAWFNDLNKELGQSGFGILCLTGGNLTAPWIAFEAGAIANRFGQTKVCPYLLDVPIAQLRKLSLPYSLFGAVGSSQKGTEQLVHSIVTCLPAGERLEERRYRINFEAHWPKLKKVIAQVSKEPDPPSEHEQLLERLSNQNQQLMERLQSQDAKLEAILPKFEDVLRKRFGALAQGTAADHDGGGNPAR